jgi:hypothetical protein
MRKWLFISLVTAALIPAPALAKIAPDSLFGSGGGVPGTVKSFLGAVPIEAMQPYPGFEGAVHVATGDVDGDGVADIVTGPGGGIGPRVKVVSGTNGAVIRDFLAYAPSFTGGVYVGSADLNGDGFADVLTGAGPSGTPHVKVFDGKSGSSLKSFFAFDPGFSGGVVVAAGDVFGDGIVDIIAGTANGGGNISVFNSDSLSVISKFSPFSPGFAGGVSLATGRYFGTDALIVGAGAGDSPEVKIFSLKDLTLVGSFLAFEPGFRGGVNVGAGQIGGRDSLIFGMASDGGFARLVDVSARAGRMSLSRDAVAETFQPFGPDYTGGLFVSGVAGVPEPASWALMIAGFGLVGGALRKTRSRRHQSVGFITT